MDLNYSNCNWITISEKAFTGGYDCIKCQRILLILHWRRCGGTLNESTMVNGLSGCPLKWHDHKTGDKWERSTCVDLCKWEHDAKVFVSYLNAHQRATLAEKKFNNQANKIINSVDASLHFSPNTPILAEWVLEESGHASWDGGHPSAQKYRPPTT